MLPKPTCPVSTLVYFEKTLYAHKETHPKLTLEEYLKRHGMECWAADLAAVFDEFGVKTCWMQTMRVSIERNSQNAFKVFFGGSNAFKMFVRDERYTHFVCATNTECKCNFCLLTRKVHGTLSS